MNTSTNVLGEGEVVVAANLATEDYLVYHPGASQAEAEVWAYCFLAWERRRLPRSEEPITRRKVRHSGRQGGG